MSVTAQQVIDGARRRLGDQLPARNYVIFHDPIAGVVEFKYALGDIREGTRFCAGLQTYFVMSSDDATLTANVLVDQGDPAVTMAPGTIVFVGPRYSGYEIFTAANDELNSLSSPTNGLYQMKATEFTFNNATTGYDLGSSTNILSVYDVKVQTPGPYKYWPRVPRSGYRLERTANTTDFPSGQALQLFVGAWQSYIVHVTYKASFGQFTALTDTLSSVGLPDSAAAIMFAGAAITCLAGAEAARNDIDRQGDVRRAGEVPAGAISNSLGSLLRDHQLRVSEEAARLASQYPPNWGF